MDPKTLFSHQKTRETGPLGAWAFLIVPQPFHRSTVPRAWVVSPSRLWLEDHRVAWRFTGTKRDKVSPLSSCSSEERRMGVRSHDRVECSAAPPPLFPRQHTVHEGIPRAFCAYRIKLKCRCFFVGSAISPLERSYPMVPCKVETGRDEMALRDNIVTLVAEGKRPCSSVTHLGLSGIQQKNNGWTPIGLFTAR